LVASEMLCFSFAFMTRNNYWLRARSLFNCALTWVPIARRPATALP
jgi:hypothetical protein